MSRPLYLGVDPGKRGGLCLLDAAGQIALLRPMPIAPKPAGARREKRGAGANEQVDVVAIGDLIRAHFHQIRGALVEHQEPRGRQLLAVAAQQHGYGMLCGVVVGAGIQLEVVRPQDWKTAMGVSLRKARGDTKEQHNAKLKALAIARAKELWPHEDFLATDRSRVPHDGMAEAALIAEHLRRRHG